MPDDIGRRVSRMARFQQTLRRLARGDEAFVQDEAGLGLDRAGHRPQIPGPPRCFGSGGRWLSGRWRPAWNGTERTWSTALLTSGTGTLRSADGI